MDEIKTIREALEELALESGYAKGVASSALGALSRLAEPGEDAREDFHRRMLLAFDDIRRKRRDDGRSERAPGDCAAWVLDQMPALIERYVQVAKARWDARGQTVAVCKRAMDNLALLPELDGEMRRCAEAAIDAEIKEALDEDAHS